MDEALLRVTRDGTVTGQANELYDAQMKRVARELDGTATYYVFDGEKIARVEQPEAGTRDFYVQEGQSIYSSLVSVHDEAPDAQYWYLFDALGSTMGLVDANGNLSGKLQYDAFGNVLAEEDVPRSAFFKYVGAYQYMPEEFEDMMLLWHRWYDPTVGRFVGRDRVLPKWGPTRYAYALQQPTGLVDVNGKTPVTPGTWVDQPTGRTDWLTCEYLYNLCTSAMYTKFAACMVPVAYSLVGDVALCAGLGIIVVVATAEAGPGAVAGGVFVAQICLLALGAATAAAATACAVNVCRDYKWCLEQYEACELRHPPAGN